MTEKGLAVFDLDGTITKKDTFIEFIRFVHGSITLYLGMILQLPFIGLFYLKLYPKLLKKYLKVAHMDKQNNHSYILVLIQVYF